ncbi:MAG: thioredoxin fold domain-containing protein [Gammaproteobacteria bacterium]|nr:thioredoxin fold domain-containing protein [Gammaproteobacteria bacterium]
MQVFRVFQLVSMFFILVPAVSWAVGSKIPMSDNLNSIGSEALAAKKPVMLVFAAKDCGYCDRLEEDHLAPMSLSKEYTSRVIIRKVMIDTYDDIRDFNGDKRSGDDIADKYGVTVTPTVMIFDNEGKRLSKKLIGYNGNEYFGWDLEKLISNAESELAQHL